MSLIATSTARSSNVARKGLPVVGRREEPDHARDLSGVALHTSESGC